MPIKILVMPGGFEFEAVSGQSLLRAAASAGIELPSSCRNGTCRTCICQLSSGKIRHTIDWPGLSAEEKADGWILPCVAEAMSDSTLISPLAFSVFNAQ